MSGATHLRMVIALLVVGGTTSLAPYVALSFQGHHAVLPIRLGRRILIPLAVRLSRGSIIARNLLVVVSMIGVLFWSYLALAAMKYGWSIAAMIGFFAAVSAYCLWALKFSKEVRAELDRRAMQ